MRLALRVRSTYPSAACRPFNLRQNLGSHVGRVNLYLMDTNVDENRPEDKMLSARLYTADEEERLRQLIVLGVGGVRALRELHIEPIVWHANEDHTAFMMLERLRLERANDVSLKLPSKKCGKPRFSQHTRLSRQATTSSPTGCWTVMPAAFGSRLESTETHS